ncbi:MAG: matrixin family metalloprotease [Candidatus Korobacteraceae bacterium]
MTFPLKAWILTSVLVLVAAGMLAPAADSYVFNLTVPSGGGEPARDRWDFTAFPVVWNLNPSTQGANISGSRTVTQVIETAFGSWKAAPNAILEINRGSNTTISSLEQLGDSGTNLICFRCDHDNFDDTQTLALTLTFVAEQPLQPDFHGGRTKAAGQIVKSAIFFNPNVTFTTDARTPGTQIQDLEAVAVHEIGHFFGLNHSPVVRAVMYRSASDIHTLGYDDVAALSMLYPGACQVVATGSISGTVRRSTGTAIFGAHVFAESLSASQPFPSSIRKTPIGTLTRPDGSYRIDGLPPDSYVVLVEPMDGPVEDGDFGSGDSGYAGTFGRSTIESDFNTGWR